MDSLTIGKVARLATVGVETVRFYERKGLIAEPPRRPSSGYRQYPIEAVAQIRFIRRAKKLGFSLREIKELLSLRINPESTCADIRERSKAKIADIDEKLRTLRQQAKARLRELWGVSTWEAPWTFRRAGCSRDARRGAGARGEPPPQAGAEASIGLRALPLRQRYSRFRDAPERCGRSSRNNRRWRSHARRNRRATRRTKKGVLDSKPRRYTSRAQGDPLRRTPGV